MKFRLSIAFVLLLAGAFFMPGTASAQTSIHSTNWTSAVIGSTAGSAGTSTGAGDGWIDNAGSVASQTTTAGVIVASGSTPWSSYTLLLRPTSENVLNEHEVVYFKWAPSANTGVQGYERWISNGNGYFVGCGTTSSPNLELFKDVAGSYTALGSQITYGAPTTNDIMTLTMMSFGASPTTLSATLYDTTAGRVISTDYYQDSTSALQVAGQMGFAGQGTETIQQAQTYSDATVTSVACNSTAIHYSPANWAGSSGRTGSTYMRSWTAGAYSQIYWSTTSASPTCELNLTNTYGTNSYISYVIDNSLYDNVVVPNAGYINIPVFGTGNHVLTVYTRNSSIAGGRWGETNTWTLAGVSLDNNATAGTAPTWNGKWVLEVGDSITEGYNADPSSLPDNLWDYSHLAGEAYLFNGYDYSVSACGSSGWIEPGDTAGDVPAYYAMTGTTGSKTYAGNSSSRWCNIDSTTSLLDSSSQISAYGSTGQTPSAITINYCTNETQDSANTTDMTNSIIGCLTALRTAAPNAWIIVFVPFNLYDTQITNFASSATYITALKAAVAAYQAANPTDTKTILADYGSSFGYLLGSISLTVHPNATGHGLIAPKVAGTVLSKLLAVSGRGRTLK